MVRRMGLLAALAVTLAGGLLADPGDPPSRVARLNYENGPVSFRPGSVDDWTAATPNYPLTTGDHLWADQGAQAEMHIGSTAVRLKSETALSFLNLDDRTVQLSLTEGSIHVRIRNLRDDETFEIDTPNVAISLLRPGDYRINADADNAVTSVAVIGGEAELTGGGTSFPVHPREFARITGTDSISRDLIDMPPLDAFDRWSEDRDRREAQSQSVRYVPREMIGYEDLDENGVWREEPQYGWVWVPTHVEVGWAPYRYGHWVWVAPWGWTWVDDAPWGFAPFHYGRWAFAGGGWVWIPGRIVERPVYAPALVAFVGAGGFSVSVGIGGGAGVAWFPLGPGEVYRPAYRVSNTYVQNINITHVNVTNVNVTNVRYVNQGVQGAVTAVPQQTFVGARPVGRTATVVPSRVAATAPVVGATPNVAPRPESIAARPAAPVAQLPMRAMQRTVVARATPPPPPVPFRAQQAALAANPGRPLTSESMESLRPNQPVTPRFRSAAPVGQTAPPSPAITPAANPRPQGFPPPRNDRPPNPNAPRPLETQRPVYPSGPPPARPESEIQPRPAPPVRPQARPESEIQPRSAPPVRPPARPEPEVQPRSAPPAPSPAPQQAAPPRENSRPAPAAAERPERPAPRRVEPRPENQNREERKQN